MHIKRIFDVLLAVISLVLLFVPLLVICLIIYIQTKQSPFFIQERGLLLNKCRFKIFKFRTIINIDSGLNEGNDRYPLKNINLNVFVHPFCKFLRRTGIDELPQLINILKGDMSFVGPRPLDLKDLKNIKKNYPAQYKKKDKINAIPGLTGFWQITRNDVRGVNYLVMADKYYEENQSFLFDLEIIVYSFYIALKGQNKDAIPFESKSNLMLTLKITE